MRSWLPPAHLLLSLVIVLWDIVLAGRIARLPQAARPFAALTGLAGLLLLPALVVSLASTTVVTGRAILFIDWIWPVVLVLFAIQAVFALMRGVVNPAWGIPIAVYNVIVATAGVVRYLVSHGVPLPDTMLLVLASQSAALSLATSPLALSTPIYLNVPMVAPAFPALRGSTASLRAFLAALALGWSVLIVLQAPRSIEGLEVYHKHAADRLTERPEGDFRIGVKLFPDIGLPPPAPSVLNDIALADTLGADLVSVVVVPDVTNTVLDSLSHAISQLQRDSVVLIVTLGYRGKLIPELGRSPLNAGARIDAIRRIVRRLHPNILVPAEDPYGVGARLLGVLPVATWKDYFTRAAAAAKAADRRVRVGISAAAFEARDSTLYAWAVGPSSPIDVVGFSFFPDRLGGQSLETYMRAADRWLRVMPPAKDHWVFAAGGFPLAHGERSQSESIWATLAWATAHPSIKGLVVYEAGDYGQSRGLRAPSGRLRVATFDLIGAIRGLRETAISTPTP